MTSWEVLVLHPSFFSYIFTCCGYETRPFRTGETCFGGLSDCEGPGKAILDPGPANTAVRPPARPQPLWKGLKELEGHAEMRKWTGIESENIDVEQTVPSKRSKTNSNDRI